MKKNKNMKLVSELDAAVFMEYRYHLAGLVGKDEIIQEK